MTDRAPPHDYRREVTDKVIELMQSGTAPWQQPWTSNSPRMPMNPTTGKQYRGGNVLSLLIEGMSRGYDDNRWMTYRQAAEKGWQVRKGEKGSRIEFWEVKPGRAGPDDGDDDKPHSRLIHKTYTVFNGQQIDGIPELKLEPRQPFEIIEAGERILKDSGADIRHGGGRAFYRPSDDIIQLPQKDAFADPPAYYGTACHELAHWTGAKHRLNRLTDNQPFGSPEYSREEIRADLTSLFLAAELGIPYDPKDQASYIQSWIKVLQNDKNEVFRAAADASKACDYLHSLENGKVKAAEPGPHAERVTGEPQERTARNR
jgi:antirestriction protein ArdC